MIASLPTGLRGRLLAIAVTVIGLLILWFGIVAPLLDAYDEQASHLAEQQQLVDHMDALVATLPSLRARVEMATKAGSTHSLLVEGATEAIAAASLQTMIHDMAESAGTNLLSVESLPSENVGSYSWIGLKLAIDARYPALILLLQQIEASPIPIVVDDLQIHATVYNAQVFRGPQTELAQQSPPEMLSVTLSVHALHIDNPAAGGT